MKKGYFTSFDGTKIYYEFQDRHKNFKPVVSFIHGGCGGNMSVFESQREFLGGEYPTLAFDLRSGGLSDLGNGDKSFYEMDNFARDFFGLLKHEKIERTHVVAYSTGTTIAIKAYDIHPEPILSLSLLNPTDNPIGNTCRFNQFMVHSGLCSLLENFFNGIAIGINSFRDVPRTHYKFKPEIKKGIASYVDWDYLLSRTPEELKSRLGLVKERFSWNVEDIVENIDVPTLCIGASKDIWTLPETAESIARRVKNGKGKAIIVEGEHGGIYTNPREINEHLLEFISSQN